MAFYFRVLFASIAATVSSLALAYTITTTQNGTTVSWKSFLPYIQMAGNPANRNGISGGDFFRIVSTSFQRWQQASQNNVGFDFWQGDNNSVYEPNSDYNGISSIYFASNANGSTFMDSYALAVTQVWYNTNTGDILETDIVLNDVNYVFSTNPADSTGPGNGNWGSSRAYLGNVVTHELGHAYGLNHSAYAQSTMMYVEAPQEAYPSCDDQAGIRAAYNPGGNGRGQITGRVVTPSGSPLLGANVTAISRVRGTPMASALTNANGDYTIKGIEPGTYTIMVEPYLAPVSSLPPYYAGLSHNLCSMGRKFSRTFSGSTVTGQLNAIKVGVSGTGHVPTVTVQCGSTSGAVTADLADSKTSVNPPVIFDSATANDPTGISIMDRFSGTNNLYFKLKSVSGKLRVTTTAYALFSMVDTTIELLNSGGQVMAAYTQANTFSGNSGFKNFDSLLAYNDLPFDDYVVHITRTSLSSTFFPGGSTFVDSIPFVVLNIALNDADPMLAGEIPANGRCEQSDTFGGYRSPAGDPPRKNTDSDDDQSSGGCGMIETQGGSGPSNGAMVGFLLPFLLMGAYANIRRLRSCVSRR